MSKKENSKEGCNICAGEMKGEFFVITAAGILAGGLLAWKLYAVSPSAPATKEISTAGKIGAAVAAGVAVAGVSVWDGIRRARSGAFVDRPEERMVMEEEPPNQENVGMRLTEYVPDN